MTRCRTTRPSGIRRGWRGRRALCVGLVGVLGLLSVPLAGEPTTRPTRGAVIPIHGVIDDIMRDSIERRLTEAQIAGATVVIFEMDTPGGMVTSALSICQMIKTLPADLRTVAWVNPRAYSAGAMISVACNEIWMSPASAIGDCAPIMVAPTGGVAELGGTERAKAESPILQEFRESAARNGYDQLLSRAMVVMSAEVWWLEHMSTGERRFVDELEKKALMDDVAEGERQWRLIESYTNVATGKPVPLSQPIDRADTLLTLGQDEAVAFGFARGVVRDIAELSNRLELSGLPLRYPASGWERFAAWLNSPLVRGVLFMIVLIGAYVEFQQPGLIFPGVTAAVALVIFLAAPYAAGLANIWTFVLLGIGLVLLAVELFVLPGFGIAGILGIALILVAVIGTFVPQEPAPGTEPAPFFSWPSLPGTWKAIERGIQVLAGSVLVAILGILLLIRYLPRVRLAQGVVAPNPDAAGLALVDPTERLIQIGDVGVVTGDLRPGGQARFGQEVVEVRSQGEYVEAGRRVQVLKREGMRIVVRPLPPEQAG